LNYLVSNCVKLQVTASRAAQSADCHTLSPVDLKVVTLDAEQACVYRLAIEPLGLKNVVIALISGETLHHRAATFCTGEHAFTHI
jgi:hypothetical protein